MSNNTNEKPVSVKLSIQDWIKVSVSIIVITATQTFIAGRYLSKFESRVEAIELKNKEQDDAINSAALRVASDKDRLNETLTMMSVDIGEIKGVMKGVLIEIGKEKN